MPKAEKIDVSKVVFRPKTSWQKDDCLAARPGCQGLSSWEAVIGNAMIRTCENKTCKEAAAEIAVRSAAVFA